MTEKTYGTASGTIHYWTNGISDGDAVTLVFLPGLTTDHKLFDRQIEYFKDKSNALPTYKRLGLGIAKINFVSALDFLLYLQFLNNVEGL